MYAAEFFFATDNCCATENRLGRTYSFSACWCFFCKWDGIVAVQIVQPSLPISRHEGHKEKPLHLCAVCLEAAFPDFMRRCSHFYVGRFRYKEILNWVHRN